MREYLFGFLWSIFLITFFWNYLLGVWFLFFSIIVLNRWIFFTFWCIVWITSIPLSIAVNELPDSNQKQFIWVVSKSLWVWRYELEWSEKTFILTTNKKIVLWSKIRVQSFQYIFPEKIQIFWYKWNVHEIINWWFSYEKRLYVKWYAWDIQYPSIITVLWREISAYRKFENKIIETYWKWHIGWLLQWMIVWWRRWITKEQYTTFIDSGLVHIIAVSWSNIMMLIIIFSWMLFRVPVFWKRFLLWGVVIFYLLFCWIDSSIVRATLFALINILVIYYWGRISLERLLCYTLSLILLYNPFLFVYDLWLLLSVSALLWLYFWNKYFSVWVRFVNIYILPSFFATLGVVPILLIYVWKFNVLSPLCTIIIWPVLSPLLIVSIVSLFVDIPFLKNVSSFWLSSIYKLASYGQQFWVYIEIESLLVSMCVSWCLIVSLYVIKNQIKKSIKNTTRKKK